MKILMLTPYLPYPPASGGQIRTLNLLKYLNKNHEVTLISLYKNDKEKEYAKYLSSYTHRVFTCKRPEKPWQFKNIVKAVCSVLPFLIVRNYSYEAAEKIKELLEHEQFDVIHAETFYIMPHIPKTKTPILLVEQTIEYKVYQHFLSTLPFLIRFVLQIDIFKLKFWELHYWKKASIVAAVSSADQQIIKSLQPNIKTIVIPNGAGDDMFVTSLPEKNLDAPKLLFVGNFYWLQNVEAAHYIMDTLFSEIKKHIPRVKLIIAGQNADEKINTSPDSQIEIITLKSDDTETVQRLYHDATLFIAPIFGPGGTRLKILAAMASGLPVVSTMTGVEGLDVKNGEHVLIGDSASEMITQIAQVLQNKEMYNKMRKNSYNLAKEKYSWSSISHKLEDVYTSIIQNK